MAEVKVSDGSVWPRPALESDEHYGVGHRLRYTPVEDISRGDLLEAAAIVSAYEYLVGVSTQAKRDLVCREVRAALKKESDND